MPINSAAPRLSHPLAGADLGTLARVVAAHGLPGRLGALRFGVAVVAALGRLPFSIAEAAYVAAKGVEVEPPIFILGHWRSGTTHLYNVMSRSPAFASVSPFAAALPWDFLLLGRWLAPWLEKALPPHRYIDQVAVERDSPQEDEIALANMMPLSFYHGLYFPRRLHAAFNAGVFFDGVGERGIDAWAATQRYFYRKLQLAAPGRRLLIKNPVHTARVGLLQQLWPGAKFIHIHRNPYIVFASMRNFYRALLAQFALQPHDDLDIDGLIIEGYRRMMAAFDADRALLSPDQLIEFSFEDFEVAPLGHLARLHDQLGLAGFDRARPDFTAYLNRVGSYRKNRYAFAPELIAKVDAHWGSQVARWGYRPPG